MSSLDFFTLWYMGSAHIAFIIRELLLTWRGRTDEDDDDDGEIILNQLL